VLVDPSAQI